MATPTASRILIVIRSAEKTWPDYSRLTKAQMADRRNTHHSRTFKGSGHARQNRIQAESQNTAGTVEYQD
jgi:hypothetical protein